MRSTASDSRRQNGERERRNDPWLGKTGAKLTAQSKPIKLLLSYGRRDAAGLANRLGVIQT